MRAYTLLATFCIVAGLAAPASAADPKPQSEKRVCRSVPSNYSSIPTLVCHRASEWEQIDQQRKARFSQSRDSAHAGETKKAD
jgi:hypothetical protein